MQNKFEDIFVDIRRLRELHSNHDNIGEPVLEKACHKSHQLAVRSPSLQRANNSKQDDIKEEMSLQWPKTEGSHFRTLQEALGQTIGDLAQMIVFN